MSLATAGPGSLLYQMWSELTKAGGRPPIVRRLPLELSATVLQASVRIENAFGYFLACAIITDSAPTVGRTATLTSGQRNLTGGFVPMNLIMTQNAQQLGWWRPVVVRPNDVLTVSINQGLSAGATVVVVGMYPGVHWRPPSIDGNTFLEQVWLSFTFDNENTDLTRQIELPWDGVLYDVTTSPVAASPTTSDVTMFIDNTKQPLSEAPVSLALLSEGNQPIATQSLLYPVRKNQNFIMDLRRGGVTNAPQFTLRAGKPWDWSG